MTTLTTTRVSSVCHQSNELNQSGQFGVNNNVPRESGMSIYLPEGPPVARHLSRKSLAASRGSLAPGATSSPAPPLTK